MDIFNLQFHCIKLIWHESSLHSTLCNSYFGAFFEPVVAGQTSPLCFSVWWVLYLNHCCVLGVNLELKNHSERKKRKKYVVVMSATLHWQVHLSLHKTGKIKDSCFVYKVLHSHYCLTLPPHSNAR